MIPLTTLPRCCTCRNHGSDLDGNDAITGGTSTSDNFRVSGTASNADMTVVTGFETITASDTTTGDGLRLTNPLPRKVADY